MKQRLATFHLPSAEADDAALEAAWNEFEAHWRAKGLRPADQPTRSTDHSVTYRLFEVGIYEELEHATLDFDIRKLMSRLISFAAYPVGMGALVSAIVQEAHLHSVLQVIS